jgi:DNA processing protein
MESEKETLLWMILNALPEVGPATFRRLKERFNGRIQDVFLASFEELAAIGGVSCAAAKHIAHWQAYFNVDKEQQQLAVTNTRFMAQKDKNYPPLLREIYDAPIGLYVKGELDLSRGGCVAIVGTRKATTYGMKLAHDFARELALLGFTIVSGMALGIDSGAHEGALAAEGKTVAVLGCGIDIIYPQENKKLYSRIVENGSVLSEFSIGRKADKMTFPIRNRIIAGMCSHVIVIESNEGGGSMITAHMANEYGRSVMAVPGRIEQSSSRGCHSLIRQGATLVSCMDHILEELHYVDQKNLDFDPPKTFGLREEILADPVERCVIDFLKTNGTASLDEIADALAIPVHHLLSRVQLLELRQLLQCDRNGSYAYCKN